MEIAMRQRAYELEVVYRQYDPATAVNRLCVTVAQLEAELAKARRERDQARDAASAWAERASVLLGAQEQVLPVDQP